MSSELVYRRVTVIPLHHREKLSSGTCRNTRLPVRSLTATDLHVNGNKAVK